MLVYMRTKQLLRLNDFLVSLEVLSHSVMFDSVTVWTVACQTPLFIGFPRQEYWNGLQFPTQGDLLTVVLIVFTGAFYVSCFGRQNKFFTTEPPGKSSGFTGRVEEVVSECEFMH